MAKPLDIVESPHSEDTKLIAEASSSSARWHRVMLATPTADGCIVETAVRHFDANGNVTAISSALVYVPGAAVEHDPDNPEYCFLR